MTVRVVVPHSGLTLTCSFFLDLNLIFILILRQCLLCSSKHHHPIWLILLSEKQTRKKKKRIQRKELVHKGTENRQLRINKFEESTEKVLLIHKRIDDFEKLKTLNRRLEALNRGVVYLTEEMRNGVATTRDS